MLNIYRNIHPLAKTLVWAAVIAALILIVALAFNTAGVVAAAQVGAAAGTFITAILILEQVREMREARLAQERPQVIVDIDNSNSPFVYVVLRNIGNGAAKNITFDFSAPIEIPESRQNPALAPVTEQPYFKNGLPYLAPGAEISTLWGSLRTLGNFLREEGLEDGIRVTSYYQAITGEPGKMEWVLNPLLLVDTLSLGEETLEDHVKKAAAAVDDIAESSAEELSLRKKELAVLTEIKSIHRQLYRPRDELERAQAQRSPLDQQTRNRIIRAICMEWETTDGHMNSEAIYERLVNEGEEPPANTMKELLEELKAMLLIRGAFFLGRDEIVRHGNMRITDVDPDLCANLD